MAQKFNNSITGRVFDIETGESLVAVHVYLSNTTIGDVTNSEGMFRIQNIPPGNYNLVYHFIGFKKIIKNIDIGTEDKLTGDAGLSQTQYILDSLQVKGERDRRWEQYLRRFERNFIGTSDNAGETKILNPEVLDFEKEIWGVYSAKARQELHIINDALGYESFVNLILFEWNYFNDTGQAQYFVRMNELEAESDAELEEWKMKREVTYRESVRHFLKGLLYMAKTPLHEGTYFQNGLLTIATIWYKHGEKTYLNGGKIQKLKDEDKYKYDKLIPANNEYEVTGFKFKFDSNKHKLNVIPENGGLSYLGYHNRKTKEYIFVIDENGNLLNPLDVEISGHWGKFRFGDFLPFNYSPEEE